MFRLAAGAFVLALALGAPAWGQGDIQGIVKDVEPANNSGAGHDATSRGAGMAGSPPAGPSATSSPAVMMPGHPAVDAGGVVARVDRSARVIVFQDGAEDGR